MTFIFGFSAESYLLPMSFFPVKASMPFLLPVCALRWSSKIKVQESPVSYQLDHGQNVFTQLRRGRELNRVMQTAFLSPFSIDECSLHELVENSSEFDLMTCSFKLLFILLTSFCAPIPSLSKFTNNPGDQKGQALRQCWIYSRWRNEILSHSCSSELKSPPIHGAVCAQSLLSAKNQSAHGARSSTKCISF